MEKIVFNKITLIVSYNHFRNFSFFVLSLAVTWDKIFEYEFLTYKLLVEIFLKNFHRKPYNITLLSLIMNYNIRSSNRYAESSLGRAK